MTFFHHLRQHRLVRESFVLLFLIWILITIFIGYGARNYNQLYYNNLQENIRYNLVDYIGEYEHVMSALALFISESEEVTPSEFANFCGGFCATGEGIVLVTYAPAGIVEYVYPSSEIDAYDGFDVIGNFNVEEFTKFEQSRAAGTMFLTYDDDAIIYHHPVKDDDDAFVGLISLRVDLALFQAGLPDVIADEDVVLVTGDQWYLLGSADSPVDPDELVSTTLSGIDYRFYVSYYNDNYDVVFTTVAIAEVTLFLALAIIFLLIYRNHMQVIDLVERVEYSYHYSYETGLKNRQSLYEDFDDIRKANERFYIAYALFNNVKFINYKYGHEIGADVIRAAINLIQGVTRDNTTMYHIGGDEYAFVFSSSKRTEVQNTIKRILRVFDRDIVIKRIRTNISITLGVVNYPDEGVTIDELIKNAHLVLSQSKIQNTNDYVFFRSGVISDMITNQDFDDYVNHLNLQQFGVHLMPIVDCMSDRIVGFECLSRAKNEFNEQISTSSVISSLERSGRIQELDEIVFKKMLGYMQRINDQFPDNHLFLSANASALSFNEQFVETIIRYYREAKLKRGTIVLELTESYKVEDHDYLIRLFKRLNRVGIRTAIDDFGSGYSSLSYISKFPVYSIKVDKEYVRDYYKNEFNRTLFLTLQPIAKVLKCKLIAEGVDDPETLDFLRQNECEWYQGYLFSKGVPFETAMAMIEQESTMTKE